MEGKKKYIVLLIFLLIGLSVFTFANPGENEEELNGSENGSKEVKKDNESDKTDNTIVVDETENDEENSKSNRNSTVGNSNNNKGNQTDKKQDNTYQDALRAVEIAENSLNKEDSSKARTLVDRVTDETKKQELASRLDAVDAAINATELIAALEEMVKNATNKDDMDSARNFRDTNSIQDVISALTTEDVKQNLQGRLDDVNIILNDTTPALIMGIEDGQITNEDVTLTVNEENVTIKVTLNGQEIDPLATFTEEGEYVYTVLDQAFNESSVTFTIDKTAAKKNAVNANVNGYKNEVKTQYAINGKTITAYISINEELKNNPTFIFFANGKEIARVANENVVASTSQNNDYPYVYTAVLEINENLVAEDGNITFHVVDILDKAGNKTDDITKMSVGEKVIILDRTENRVTQTFFRKGNSVEVGKTYYIKNGGKVQFNIGFREELGEDAVVTIGGKEVKLTFENYFAATNSYMYYGYLEIPENETELTEGQLEIVISNVTDKAGNTGFYYQTNGKKVYETFTTNVTTNGKTVIYDRTPAARVYSTLRVNKTEYIENGVKYYYVKNGDSFEFAISFTEELTTAPTVTIAGREVEMVLNEKVKNNENKFLYEGTFTIDANEKDLKQGTLEIKVSNIKDIALNETVLEDQTITSNGRSVVYDNRNPVIEGINNNYHYNTPVTINEVKYAVHNVSPIASATIDGEKYELGTKYDVEGTHEFVAYDRAGNRVRVTFTIDYTAPAITGVDETKATNKNEIVYVSDKNLDKVVIDGTEYTASDFTTVDGLIKFQKKITHEGTHTVVAYDKAGNESTVTFVIDKTAPEYATLRMLGGRALKENGVQTWYVKAGETINVYMTFKEKLATNAKVKLNGEELSTSYIKEVDGTYMYGATYKVTENSKQGAVSIEVYGYADKVGNVGVTLTNDDITTPGQKNVSIDTIAPVHSSIRMLGGKGYWENGKYTMYATNGTTIYVYTTFTERLATNPTVTLNGKVSKLAYLAKISDDSYIYAAEFKLTEDDGLKDGDLSVKVVGYADKVGNVGVKLTNDDIELGSQKYIVIDKTAPELEIDYRPELADKRTDVVGSDTNKIVFKVYKGTEVVKTVDEKSNYKRFSIDWLGDGEYKVVVTDQAGNSTETMATIDHTAPVVTPSYTEKTVEGDKTKEFTDFPTFEITDLTEVTTKLESGSVDMSKVGTYTLSYSFTDKFNNVTTKDIIVNVVDTTSPVVTAKAKNNVHVEYGTGTYTELGATVTDNIDADYEKSAPSYINLYELGENNATGPFVRRLAEGETVDPNVIGKYLLVYMAEDAEGNVSNNQLQQSKIWVIVSDTTAPKLSLDFREDTLEKKTDVITSDLQDVTLYAYRDGKLVKTYPGGKSFRTNFDWFGNGEYRVVARDLSGNESEITYTLGKNTLKPTNGVMDLTGDMTLWNDSLYYDETGNGTKGDIINASGDIVINGNGYTVTQIASTKDAYMEWPTGYKAPAMSNIFASKNGSVTVNNLTLKGQITANNLGFYEHPTKKNVLNNVTMKNLEVVSFSQLAGGLILWGEGEINNSIITGTKMSSMDEAGFPLYDLVLTQSSILEMNGGEVGTVYVWNKTKATFNNVKVDTIETATRTNVNGHLTIGDGTTVNKIVAKAILVDGTDLTKRYNAINIKSGAKVKVLDLSEVDLINEVVIEDGAIVEKIITKFGELTQEEFDNLLNTPEGKLKLAFLQGGTYKLTEDTTLTEEIELASNKTLVIDLDGKELVIDNPDDDSSRLIKNKGNLTIKDGDLVNQDTHSYGIVSNEGTLTIDNVDVKDNGSKDGSTFDNNGTLIIKDSTIKVTSISSTINGKTQKWGDAAVSSTGTLEIKNTTITADSQSSYAIRVTAGNASLDNVNITNTKGAFGITGGTANIKNSNFETHKYYTIYAESSNNVSVTVDGGKYNSARAAIYLLNASAAKDVTVLVKGGTFISKSASYEVIHTDSAQADQTFDVIIKGGKFTGTLNDVTAYLADGYEQNAQGEVVEKVIVPVVE